MTVPGGSYPDGTFDDDLTGLGGLDEATWKQSKFDAAVGPYNVAQGNFKGEFVSAVLVNGEIVRLDNRIDALEIGTERAYRYTYSESDVWTKHPAAYKVVVDVLSGATSGTQPSSTDGLGGWSGGWERIEFTGAALEALPSSVAITIGEGTAGGSTAQAGASSFGSFLIVAGATTTNYGPGSRTYKMRGGNGGGDAANGTAGSNGPFHPGGSGGQVPGGPGNGGPGGHGFSIDLGRLGPGSAGGGGAGRVSIFGAGGPGGHGGWPSGPGGARGYGGNGILSGNGAAGAVFVTVYVADDFGQPPSTPGGLAASSVTSNSAHVTWSASLDDVMVNNYVLYLNGARYGVVTTLYHDFVGLTPSTNYSVRIQAVDIGDNVSELSDPLSFTTTA
ncbi:fibronectin type III domain-containing protein [Rhodococcus phenolicus]|uniref:fibronectin type III domain-containing protein n=1 Tax=Rhodococcus phenolicus TaxID=263849 RepID=UPI000A4B58D3|nr:fibronectin type III domain-containing protein [Rhodococcus phenolicus]